LLDRQIRGGEQHTGLLAPDYHAGVIGNSTLSGMTWLWSPLLPFRGPGEIHSFALTLPEFCSPAAFTSQPFKPG